MASIIIGGSVGYLFGSLLSHLLFGPGPGRRRPREARPAGRPGAAFLLLTVATFGGMAVAGLAGA